MLLTGDSQKVNINKEMVVSTLKYLRKKESKHVVFIRCQQMSWTTADISSLRKSVSIFSYSTKMTCCLFFKDLLMFI
jgi:hypothetical protein